MNKIIAGCFIFFLTFSSGVSANESYFDCDKLYVTPGSIYISNEDLYLFIEGAFISVESVSKDENGIFVILARNEGQAKCARCGHEYDRRKGHKCPDK